jgi:hypothetical protein
MITNPRSKAPALGSRFGRWAVIGEERFIEYKTKYLRQVLCQCDCGTKRYVCISKLKHGRSQSCGCAPKEKHSFIILHYRT